MATITEIIRNISGLQPTEGLHSDEFPTQNPKFVDLTHSKKPIEQPSEKFIWALRSDFTVAVGSKSRRHGHPSLAIPKGKYNGSVYDAGYGRFTQTGMECYKHSGRFKREDLLSPLAIQCMEIETARAMINAYGVKSVTFFDHTGDEDGLVDFLNEKSLTSTARSYSAEFVAQASKLEKNVTLEALDELRAGKHPNQTHSYVVSTQRPSLFSRFRRSAVIAPAPTNLTVTISTEHSTSNNSSWSFFRRKSNSPKQPQRILVAPKSDSPKSSSTTTSRMPSNYKM